jgi:peptidoglycan/LPS O-acetylase OafA/YrhL
VNFFFALSGFVLMRGYSRQARRVQLVQNIARRVARLYPLHFVTLLLVMLGQAYLTQVLRTPPFVYTHNDAYHLLLNLLMAHCIGVQKGFSFNGPSWTISIMFFINLLFFWLLLRTERSWRYFVGLILLALVGLLVVGDAAPNQLFGTVVLRAILSFFVGTVLVHLVQHSSYKDSLVTRLVIDAAFVVSSVVMLIFLSLSSSSTLTAGAFVGIELVTMFLLVFPTLIFGASNGYVVSRILHWRPLGRLGKISYAIYMIHFPVQLLFHIASVSGLVSCNFDNPLALIFFILVTLMLSIPAHHLVEQPARRAILAALVKVE